MHSSFAIVLLPVGNGLWLALALQGAAQLPVGQPTLTDVAPWSLVDNAIQSREDTRTMLGCDLA